MFLTIAETLKTTIEIVISGATLIGGAWKLFLKKWLLAYKNRDQLKWENLHAIIEKQGQESVAMFECQNKEIKTIKHKLFPNGGSSIDDKVEKALSHLKQLNESVGSLQLAQRNSWDVLDLAGWESDKNGRFTYVTIALCELVGATQDELLGSSWIGRVAYFDRKPVIEAWGESVKHASDFDIPHSYHKSDGTYQKVIPVVIHNKDKDGKLISSLGRMIRIDAPYLLESKK